VARTTTISTAKPGHKTNEYPKIIRMISEIVINKETITESLNLNDIIIKHAGMKASI